MQKQTKLYALEEADRYKIIQCLSLRERKNIDEKSVDYLKDRLNDQPSLLEEKEQDIIKSYLKSEAAQDKSFGTFSKLIDNAHDLATSYLPFGRTNIEERAIENANKRLPLVKEEFYPVQLPQHEYMYDRDQNMKNTKVRDDFQKAYLNKLLYDNGLIAEKHPDADDIIRLTDNVLDTYSDTPEADKLYERTLAEEELAKVLDKDIAGVEFLGKIREDEKIAPRIVEPIKNVNFILVDSVRENQILIGEHDMAHYQMNDRGTIDSFSDVEEKNSYLDKIRKSMSAAKEKINAKLRGDKDNSIGKEQHLYSEPEETALDAKKSAGRIDDFKDIKDLLISHSYAQHQDKFMSLDVNKEESKSSFHAFQEEREGIKNADVNYLMNYIDRNEIKFSTIPFEELNRYNGNEQQKYLVQGDELKKRFLAMEEKFEKGADKEAIKKKKEKEVERA